MTTKHGQGSDDEHNPSVGYDKSDLSAKGILIFFLVLAIFTVVMNVGVIGMYFGMTKIAEKHDLELSPLAPKAVTPRAGIMQNTANVDIQKFPEPRLQSNDVSDMAKFLLQQTAALTAQPWQDAQGNVHLPIDQAIKVVETRLPIRAGTAALPNYPGAGREYASPSEAAEAAPQQNEAARGEVENLPAIK
jgi:hypothetical protein